MKSLKYMLGLVCFFGFNIAFGQNIESDLKKLDSQMEVAYKAKKITEIDYTNLKKEQSTIQLAIDKANADKVVTQDEKNKIYSKIIKFRKRLAKYIAVSEVQ